MIALRLIAGLTLRPRHERTFSKHRTRDHFAGGELHRCGVVQEASG